MRLLPLVICACAIVVSGCSGKTVGSSAGTKLAAKSIALGQVFACAVVSDGSIRCWGDNNDGELGNGTNSNSSVPVPVSNITNAIAVSAGVAKETEPCALLSDGTVQSWWGNAVPAPVPGITDAVALGSGGCGYALLGDGTIQSWGGNSLPVAISGITDAVAVAGNCALLSGGVVQCNLGAAPVAVSGISNAIAIASKFLGEMCIAARRRDSMLGIQRIGLSR